LNFYDAIFPPSLPPGLICSRGAWHHEGLSCWFVFCPSPASGCPRLSSKLTTYFWLVGKWPDSEIIFILKGDHRVMRFSSCVAPAPLSPAAGLRAVHLERSRGTLSAGACRKRLIDRFALYSRSPRARGGGERPYTLSASPISPINEAAMDRRDPSGSPRIMPLLGFSCPTLLF
jgi:hypothetical protein